MGLLDGVAKKKTFTWRESNPDHSRHSPVIVVTETSWRFYSYVIALAIHCPHSLSCEKKHRALSTRLGKAIRYLISHAGADICITLITGYSDISSSCAINVNKSVCRWRCSLAPAVLVPGCFRFLQAERFTTVRERSVAYHYTKMSMETFCRRNFWIRKHEDFCKSATPEVFSVIVI